MSASTRLRVLMVLAEPPLAELMCPVRTATSCGSSSQPRRRRNAPTRVARASGSRFATYGSLSARSVRSLYNVNGTPSRPMRRWRNRTGPGLSSLMMMAASGSSGVSRTRPQKAATRSAHRFNAS
jgi:hypothetical protein